MLTSDKIKFIEELKENMKKYKTPCKNCLIDGVCMDTCEKFKMPINKNVYFYLMNDVRLARLSKHCLKTRKYRWYVLYNDSEYLTLTPGGSVYLRRVRDYDIFKILKSSTIFNLCLGGTGWFDVFDLNLN